MTLFKIQFLYLGARLQTFLYLLVILSPLPSMIDPHHNPGTNSEQTLLFDFANELIEVQRGTVTQGHRWLQEVQG